MKDWVPSLFWDISRRWLRFDIPHQLVSAQNRADQLHSRQSAGTDNRIKTHFRPVFKLEANSWFSLWKSRMSLCAVHRSPASISRDSVSGDDKSFQKGCGCTKMDLHRRQIPSPAHNKLQPFTSRVLLQEHFPYPQKCIQVLTNLSHKTLLSTWPSSFSSWLWSISILCSLLNTEIEPIRAAASPSTFDSITWT